MSDATGSTPWDAATFSALASSEEVGVTPVAADGASGATVPVWVVAVGGELYLRSSHGRASGWYRRALRAGRLRIEARAARQLTVPVPTTACIAELDDAYRSKYAAYANSFLPRLVSAPAQQAALRLEPVAG